MFCPFTKHTEEFIKLLQEPHFVFLFKVAREHAIIIKIQKKPDLHKTQMTMKVQIILCSLFEPLSLCRKWICWAFLPLDVRWKSVQFYRRNPRAPKPRNLTYSISTKTKRSICDKMCEVWYSKFYLSKYDPDKVLVKTGIKMFCLLCISEIICARDKWLRYRPIGRLPQYQNFELASSPLLPLWNGRAYIPSNWITNIYQNQPKTIRCLGTGSWQNKKKKH